jgi:steroid 5-alpha reductase family enzyme
MTLAETAALLGLNLGLLLTAMAGLWALSLRWRGVGFIDAVWPLILAAPAAATFLLAEGDPVRKGLLLWLVTVWALPQAWRRLAPGARAEADARYAAVAETVAGRRGWSRARAGLMVFFLPQAVLAWMVSLPVQLGQVDFLPAVGWVGWTGAVLAVAGIGLEGVGSVWEVRHPATDPSAFRGPRRWLRRPEYLGDIAVWWGLFLIAAETAPGQASILGPIVLTFALAHWAKTENPRRGSDGG